MAVEHDINVIASTHNPYLVNCFREDKESVIQMEKENGESRLVPLTERINELHDSEGDVDELPLGELWFSGLLDGLPPKSSPRAVPA